MARVRTLLQLRDEVRQRANMENSTFVTDAEVNRYINESISELYDMIVEAAGQEYFLETYTFNTITGQDTYVLPSDFYLMKGVDADLGAAVPLPIRPYNLDDRHNNRWLPGLWGRFTDIRYRMLGNAHGRHENAVGDLLGSVTGFATVAVANDSFTDNQASGKLKYYVGQVLVFDPLTVPLQLATVVGVDPLLNLVTTNVDLVATGVIVNDPVHQTTIGDYAPQIRFTPEPSTANAITIWYIPHAPQLLGDTHVWNGFNGWEEYVVVDAAIRCLEKEESDTSALEVRKQRLDNRIRNLSQARDHSFGEQVTDVTSRKWVW